MSQAHSDHAHSRPDLFQQALALHQRGKLADAEALCDALLRCQPDHVGALHLAGAIALQTRRTERGVALLGQALLLAPDDAELHRDLGGGWFAAGQLEAALASYDTAIALRPDLAEAHYNRGVALNHLGRHAEAVVAFDAAIALRPDQAVVHNIRASALCFLQRYQEALAGYATALALRPDYANAYNNRGVTLMRLQRLSDALADYDRAIALNADAAESHNNRGVVLTDLQRHTEALASFDQATALQADYAEAYCNQAACLLQLGQFRRGWQLFEWRKKLKEPLADRSFPQPLWLGQEPIAGKTLFIHWEQGLGDTIQFCRYATLATAQGARVVMAVQDGLRRLLESLGPDITIIGRDEIPYALDLHCPMMSLPLAFNTTLETIPHATPYLAADPASVARWRDRLATLAGLRVGLCWAGDPRRFQRAAQETDKRRSIPLALYAPLASVDGASFVSLQKGEAAAQSAAPPAGMALHDWTNELTDFADTAALIAALDLVITVDTAVAHAAGALGKPVWLLSRYDGDWRWQTGRADSPWYPSVRLFRQPHPGDWDSVVADVAAALRERVGSVSSWRESFQQALALHQRGKPTEAEDLCAAILRQHPHDAGALHLSAVIALQTRRTERGLALLGQVIRLQPDDAEAHRDLGSGLFAAGRFTEALASYDTALALKPDLAEALYNRAVTLSQLERYTDALDSYDKAVALQPRQAVLHNGRASTLCRLQCYPEALAGYATAIALHPDYAEAHSNLGVALTRLQRHADALASHDVAVALKPDHADAHFHRAVTLSYLDRHAAALAAYDAALALQPGQAEWHDGRGHALFRLQRHQDAFAAYARAIELQPDHAGAHRGCGQALAQLGRTAEAVASYDRAIALQPDFAEAHHDRGLALQRLQRHADAVTSHARAIALQPDHVDAHWCQGVSLLTLGQFERAWPLYEWRTRRDAPFANRVFPQPLWLGRQPIAGRTLFIYSEGGLGDTLQFCRYARLLKAQGALVAMAVQTPLMRLLRTLGPDVEILDGIAVPDAFDYHCPMLSLPFACGTTLATIPHATPYLTADAAAVARWRDRLAARAGLRVGLCWAGHPRRHDPLSHAADRRRSISLADYAPLAEVAGVSFISLQKGEPAAQSAVPPAGLTLHDWTDELTDYADTAALIAALDLVITVDTSVAHAAGALGKPVWILSRFDGDWRWLLERDDSPWYPGARLFRQPRAGDWDSVLARVAVALRERAGQGE